MNELILLFSTKYFVKQESNKKISIISYDKLDNIWASQYNLQLVEIFFLQNGSTQYVFELI